MGNWHTILRQFALRQRYMDMWRTDNRGVKPTRPPLVQLLETEHWRNVRTAQGSVAANGCPLKTTPARERHKVRIRATETSRLSSGETGNLYAQQYQVGQRKAQRFAAAS